MRAAVRSNVCWDGREAETHFFDFDKPEILRKNISETAKFVLSISHLADKETKNLFREVKPEGITRFLANYSHPKGRGSFDSKALIKYIERQVDVGELRNWSVFLHSSSEAKNFENIGEFKIGLPQRGRDFDTNKIGIVRKPFDISVDLPGGPNNYKNEKGKHDYNRSYSTRTKDNGLLIIYLIDKDSDTKKGTTQKLFGDEDEAVHVVALTLVLPRTDTAQSVNYVSAPGVDSE
jgi:hypothetical protein